MVRGTRIKVTPTNGASQRTKNRCRERGELGFIVRKTPQTTLFAGNSGKLWIMLESIGSDWEGWLPMDEIIIDR
jgi:hypothetical protein